MGCGDLLCAPPAWASEAPLVIALFSVPVPDLVAGSVAIADLNRAAVLVPKPATSRESLAGTADVVGLQGVERRVAHDGGRLVRLAVFISNSGTYSLAMRSHENTTFECSETVAVGWTAFTHPQVARARSFSMVERAIGTPGAISSQIPHRSIGPSAPQKNMSP